MLFFIGKPKEKHVSCKRFKHQYLKHFCNSFLGIIIPRSDPSTVNWKSIFRPCNIILKYAKIRQIS